MSTAAIRRVSVAQACALLAEGYRYLDVRTEAEYAAGHPPGAANVPFELMGPRGAEPNPRFVEVVEANFGSDDALLVGCQRGQRSLRAAVVLRARGFRTLVELRPGYDGVRDAFGQLLEPGWARAGLPIELVSPGLCYADLLRVGGGAC